MGRHARRARQAAVEHVAHSGEENRPAACLDLPEPEAVELAREFEQSALLVGELGAAVRLRFVES